MRQNRFPAPCSSAVRMVAPRPSGGDALSQPAAGGAPITVFMVDDEPVVLRTAARLLSGAPDIHLCTCTDGAVAAEAAEALRPTLILQDINMPRADGIELVRAYRQSRVTRDVPVIVLSSEEDASIKARAFAAGADDYLVKFPDRVELLARVRHHAEAYRRRVEREDTERRLVEESRFARETFGRYLSESIVARLLASPEALALGGARQRVTIMMTDLRGFTALSERLPPERLVTLINIYLGVMTEIILCHGGMVDEFIGDAILALFGAPDPRPDDAARAVECAVAMQIAMGEVNARTSAAGLPEIEMGIGLNTGEVVLGNIGSRQRAKYAVVGAAVNLAARIESYTLGGQILVSQETLDAAGPEVIVEGSFEATPKGVAQPILIHRVVGLRDRRDLGLGRRELSLRPPAIALTARFVLLEGKDASGARMEGRVVALGRRAVKIEAPDAGARPLVNVKLSLIGPDGAPRTEDVYGKITEVDASGAMTVQLTAVPSATAEWLDGEGWRAA